MAQRFIGSIQLADYQDTKRAVRIYKDSETKEYVCKLHINGKHYEPADYFTDNHGDAHGTAEKLCKVTKLADEFLTAYPLTHYSVADRLDALDRLSVRKGHQDNTIYHWIFSDGSMLYYNKGNDGWTV